MASSGGCELKGPWRDLKGAGATCCPVTPPPNHPPGIPWALLEGYTGISGRSRVRGGRVKDLRALKTSNVVIQRFSHSFNLMLVNVPVSTDEISHTHTHTHTHTYSLGGAVFPVTLIHKSNRRYKIDSEAASQCHSPPAGSRAPWRVGFQVWGQGCTG